MPWKVVLTNVFKRRYKKKSADLQNKVDEAIKKLVNSDDPRMLGGKKYGVLKTPNPCYGYELDFRNRLLYAVDMIRKEIHLLRVCSHKEVYGKG